MVDYTQGPVPVERGVLEGFEWRRAEEILQATLQSPRTKKLHRWDIPCTEEELMRFVRWSNGDKSIMIQDISIRWSPDQREFIKSGYTPEDWAVIFPPEEEE